MKTTFKIKIVEEIEGLSLPASAFMSPNLNGMSYIPKYQFRINNAKIHCHLEEYNSEMVPSGTILAGKRFTERLGLEEGETIEMARSNLDPTEVLTLEKISQDQIQNPIPFFEGIEICEGDHIRYKESGFRVTSCTPSKGYITEDTRVNLNQPTEDRSEQPVDIPRLQATSPGHSTDGLSQIIGHEKAIQKLKKRVLLPIKNAEKANKFGYRVPNGVMLAGPPGVAKSRTAECLADSIGKKHQSFGAGDVKGMGPEGIVELFSFMKKQPDGMVVILEEIDAFANNNDNNRALVATLQQQMDMVKDDPNILIMATTNHPEELSDALLRPGRFDEIIEFSMPSEKDRQELFRFMLSDKLSSNRMDYHKFSKMTLGYSGTDIEEVINIAAGEAFLRDLNGQANATITESDLQEAIKDFRTTGDRILKVKQPKRTFDQILGHDSKVYKIKQVLDVISGKTSGKYYNKSRTLFCLHGPPGTGKGMTAEAMANHLGLPFVAISASDLDNKYVGETGKAWRRFLFYARTYGPCLIFVDEFDAIAKTSDKSDKYSTKTARLLQTQLDGTESNDGIYFVVATNHYDDLEPAIRSRFTYTYELKGPDNIDRSLAIEEFFKDLPGPPLDSLELAQEMKGWSYRNISDLKDLTCIKLDSNEWPEINTQRLKLLIQSENREKQKLTN